MKYIPGDLVIIKSCKDSSALATADAGNGGYDYQLLLDGELIFFHENELVKAG